MILTDVVWSLKAEQDWADLAKLAKCWLSEDGLFCSMIGTLAFPYFCRTMLPYFHYQWALSIQFPWGSRSPASQIIQGWRPVVIFAKTKNNRRLLGLNDTLVAPRTPEKNLHDWQQSLVVALELTKRLTRYGDVVCDPQVGTGTNAVACSLIGGRTFIGCDINERQVQTARHRVSTERPSVSVP